MVIKVTEAVREVKNVLYTILLYVGVPAMKAGAIEKIVDTSIFKEPNLIDLKLQIQWNLEIVSGRGHKQELLVKLVEISYKEELCRWEEMRKSKSQVMESHKISRISGTKFNK